MKSGATDRMLCVGGLETVSHDEIRSTFESERFGGEEDEGPSSGNVVRLRRPDPAVIGSKGIGDLEVAVRLLVSRPRPIPAERRRAGWGRRSRPLRR